MNQRLITSAVLLLALALLSLSLSAQEVTTTPVRMLPSLDPVHPNAVASLKRDFRSVTMDILTTGEPNTAYTVWWVIFNRPKECSEGIFHDGKKIARCSVAEGNAGIGDRRIVHADGAWVDESGLLKLHAQLGKGSVLRRSRRSEIHLVIRCHGPLDGIDHFLEFTTPETEGNPQLPGEATTRQVAIFNP